MPRQYVVFAFPALFFLACSLASPQFWQHMEVRSSVQHTLDEIARAVNSSDQDSRNFERLDQFVDQTNLPFRRLVKSRLELWRAELSGSGVCLRLRLLELQERPGGYYQAEVGLSTGATANWAFRQIDGRWQLTEPGVDQIGSPLISRREHFTYITYAWDEEIQPEIINLMEQARSIVETRLGVTTSLTLTVELLPIYGLKPFNSMNALAWYEYATPANPDGIKIYSPNNFAFGVYDSRDGWQHDVLSTLVHEYTHAVHHIHYKNSGKLADWMVEGLAVYISDAESAVWYACQSLAAGESIPLVDREAPVYKKDLAHIYLLDPEDTGMAYDFAGSVVAYIASERGGLDTFWNLAAAYDATSDMDRALQEKIGVALPDFEQAWTAWLGDYCK